MIKSLFTKIFQLVFIFFIAIASFACSSSDKNDKGPLDVPSDIEYRVVKNVIDRGSDRYLINVEINKIIDKASIKKIADHIRSQNTDATYIRMFFLIKGVQNGAWARVDYLPNYELDLIGISAEQEQNLENDCLQGLEGTEIIGKWKDLSPISAKALVIYKKGKKHYVRWFYPDKSFDDINLKFQNEKYKVVKNGYDEWYVIEKNGNLGTYSTKGKFSEAFLIK